MANSQPTEHHSDIQFRQLLEEAVTKPGTLMRAHSLFWNYSLGKSNPRAHPSQQSRHSVRADRVIKSLKVQTSSSSEHYSVL
jgi:hypothetical protein